MVAFGNGSHVWNKLSDNKKQLKMAVNEFCQFCYDYGIVWVRAVTIVAIPTMECFSSYQLTTHLKAAGQRILCAPYRFAECFLFLTRCEVERLAPTILVKVCHQIVEAGAHGEHDKR